MGRPNRLPLDLTSDKPRLRVLGRISVSSAIPDAYILPDTFGPVILPKQDEFTCR
jgi:hypothetical protein